MGREWGRGVRAKRDDGEKTERETERAVKEERDGESCEKERRQRRRQREL